MAGSGPRTSTSIDTQIAVVGAGPVGLMLAGELSLRGADVTVLERLTAPTTESRASTLHARTMEIFHSRGLLDALGTPPSDPRGHFGGIRLDLTTPSPYPGQWKVPQTVTEAVLQSWASSLGVRLLRGHRVHRVSPEPGRVVLEAAAPGRVVIRADHVVACDGEESTVRQLLGARFDGHDATRELLRADVSGIEIRDRRFERLPAGLAVASRRADGVTRVMVHEFAGRTGTATPEFDEVADTWRRVTGEDISGGTPLWLNAFGDANRQLTQYRHGRVLFAGDAAHRQMPSGGQALNLGLQDAVNLGWKLAAEVTGTAPPGLLDTYEAERHAVGRRVLANIDVQGLLLLGGPEIDPHRSLLTELMARPSVRAHLAGMICGVDIRYDWGSATAGSHPLLGARLPQIPVAVPTGGSTTSSLRSGRGVLLGLHGELSPELARAVAPWSDRVDAVGARCTQPDDALAGVGAVLVRPDGHVAWVSPGTGAGDLTEALTRWFGRPSTDRVLTPSRSRKDAS